MMERKVLRVLAIIFLLIPFAVWADGETPAENIVEVDDAESVDEEGGLTFEDLFRGAAIGHVSLSPNGAFVAYFRNHMLVMGNPREGYFDIRQFNNRLAIRKLVWIGPNTVWVDSWDPRNERYLGTVVRFKNLGEEGFGVDDVRDHRNPGYISDTLSDDDYHIVLARPKFEDETVAADLYTVDVFQPLDGQLEKDNRVDTGSQDFFYYQKNSAGDYILGIRMTEGVPEIWRKVPDVDLWEHVWAADKESTFVPWRMSDDAKTLWVLSDAQTDRMVAVEFDLESASFGQILYEHERVDVDGILMSRDGSRPVGVMYTEQGLLRYHFLSQEPDADFERLQALFPEKNILVVGYSDDWSIRLVFASSPTDRGAVHVCDLERDQCELVESIAPWLEGKPLNATIALDIPSTDDFVVEAFLTLPSDGNDSIPLIALPHGGPIGVSDDRYFSSEVQWLAHNGYAVLQVNYRGSSGYGEKFTQAGLRQWGRGIEDDIEAAVRSVLIDYPRIDADRIGIFGGSYGGYSAVMSIIRNPDLFKCAASFAGVMDLTLLFTESAAKQSDNLRDILIEYVGDPDADYDEQIEHSPVYRYKDIKRPVLLGHGKDDAIVDFEHSWRLQKMMRLTGAELEFILIKDVGHGFDYVNEAWEFYEPLVKFLDKHLKPHLQEPDTAGSAEEAAPERPPEARQEERRP